MKWCRKGRKLTMDEYWGSICEKCQQRSCLEKQRRCVYILLTKILSVHPEKRNNLKTTEYNYVIFLTTS